MLGWIKQMFTRRAELPEYKLSGQKANELQSSLSSVSAASRKHEQATQDLKETMEEVLRRIKT